MKEFTYYLHDTHTMQVLDQEGVGELIKIAVERGRAARPGMKIGICGEQVGSKHPNLTPLACFTLLTDAWSQCCFIATGIIMAARDWRHYMLMCK